jgi:putative membrane protein
MKHRLLLASAAAALFTASAAVAQMATPAAQDFVTMAAMSDMFEIQSSQIALEKAQSDEVKEFAEQMIEDHTAASQKLKAAVEESGDGYTIPDDLSGEHEQQLEALEGASGEDFDAAYIEAQVAAHEQALALMTSYAEGGDEEALKEHAETTRPVIAEHYEHVQQLDGSM